LLDINENTCDIRKGAVWWLRTRVCDGQLQTSLLTVISPEMV